MKMVAWFLFVGEFITDKWELLCVTDDGLSIPCQYLSYVAPLSSSKLWNEARSCRDVNKPVEVRLHRSLSELLMTTHQYIYLINYYVFI